MGGTYANWSTALNIGGTLTTGKMNIVFNPEMPYSVRVMNSNGQNVSDVFEANVFLTDEKQAIVSLDNTLLLRELTSSNRYLVLQFPLNPAEDSSVRSIYAQEVDFNNPQGEQVEFFPMQTTMYFGEEEYPLPIELNAVATPLYWDAYYQVEAEGEEILGTVFLKLSDYSIKALKSTEKLAFDISMLPEELHRHVTRSGNDDTGYLKANLKVSYQFSVPFWLDQGR